MAVLIYCIFRKNLVGCHQWVLKFKPLLGELLTDLDCFTPNFKLKYEDSQNVKADGVNTVVFNLHQIKHRTCVFFGNPVYILHITLHIAYCIATDGFEETGMSFEWELLRVMPLKNSQSYVLLPP